MEVVSKEQRINITEKDLINWIEDKLSIKVNKIIQVHGAFDEGSNKENRVIEVILT